MTRRRPSDLPPFNPPAEATASVRRRIYDTAARTTAGTDVFWQAFPSFKRAVDALPDLEPLLSVAYEMRSIPLLGYRDEGVDVPKEIFEALGVSEFFFKR